MVKLSLPAVRQVLYLAGVTTASDEKEFSSKIQRSASRSALELEMKAILRFVEISQSQRRPLPQGPLLRHYAKQMLAHSK